MKLYICGILTIVLALTCSFGDTAEQTAVERFSIQLFKIGNAPDILSKEVIANSMDFSDLINSPDIKIHPCGVFQGGVGDSAFFNVLHEDNQSTFVIKILEADLDTVTIEMSLNHRFPDKTIEVDITESRSTVSPNYIIRSREPHLSTIVLNHWMTIGGYPFENDERLILRVTK